MKRVMSITAVLAAVTCHSAYGQLDSIGGAAQNAAGQIGSTADSAADQVQSQAGQTQAGASANTQAGTDLNTNSGTNLKTQTDISSNTDIGSNTDVGANAAIGTNPNLNNDANANAGVSAAGGQSDVNASNNNLNANAQAGVNASTQNQVDRGTRNLDRNVNRGIVPPIPQQARTANNDARDARWRFTQRNGQWWYYTPQNQWMVRQNDEWQNYDDSYQPLAGGNADQGAYRSGYRGNLSNQGQYSSQQPFQGNNGNAGSGQMQPSQMQMTAHVGPVYRLHYDNTGREYICVQGQRVYFDDQVNRNRDSQSMGEENGNQNDDQQPMPNAESGDERYESERQNLDATDPADQRPLTEPQSDTENAADATPTEPPPAPSADSPATAAEPEPNASDDNDAENTSDDDNNNEKAQESNDDESEIQSKSDDAENDDESGDA